MASVAQHIDNEAIIKGPGWRSGSSLWIIVGLVFAILFAGYWLFIRTTYVPLLTNLAPQDAADIVKVLDDRKISYRVGDEGRTILVASDKADGARIELVGSELPMRGQVGFELFNQSDMGLTEFAQKINYQRALQGELARTILLMDGIKAVRVHLGMPERGVFRDLQVRPKASVALILKPGTILTERSVVGIQRVVAGAIPEMQVDDVAVLDGTGRVVSNDVPAAQEPVSVNDSILDNYRARIVSVISRRHPALRYHLNLSFRALRRQVVGQEGEGAGHLVPALAPVARAPRGEPDFAVNIRLTTPTQLDENQRLELLQLIRDTIGFDADTGDGIQFLVDAILPGETANASPASPDRVVARTAQAPGVGGKGTWETYWPFAALAMAGLLLAAWFRDRQRTSQRKREELTAFAEELRERLKASEGTPHGS